MRTRIKICGVTCVDHALQAVVAGADAIGLVFWPGTPRCISPALARDIVAALPPFVTAVGLFVNPAPAEVSAVLEQVPLGALQFHGDEPASLCGAFGRPYIKAIGVADGATADRLVEYAARYAAAAGWLFDAPPSAGLPGGTGRTFDWAAVTGIRAKPIVLSGGLHAGNVAQAIRAVRPWAVDVSSGVEMTDADGRPIKGVKDPARIAAFAAEVRHADV